MSKVLIVEDDPFLLKMYKKKFEVDGFEVLTATDGEQGLAKMKSAMPDLVLMDIMMPKLNGLEAIGRAKADPAIAKIPVIVLTNLSSTTDAEAATKKGAIGYLIKSDVTPSQVLTKVKLMLNSKK